MKVAPFVISNPSPRVWSVYRHEDYARLHEGVNVLDREQYAALKAKLAEVALGTFTTQREARAFVAGMEERA